MGEYCTICRKLIGHNSRKHDIRIFCTNYSHTPMLQFIENITETTYSMNKFEICPNCCGLINELDEIQQRFKAVRQKLTAYLNFAEMCQANAKSEITTSNSLSRTLSPQQNKPRHAKLYECEFCCKKFASKNGIALHVKKSHVVNTLWTDTHSDSSVKVKIEEIVKEETQISNSENEECNQNKDLFDKTQELKACTENTELFDVNISQSDGQKSKRKKNLEIPKQHKCATCEKVFKTHGELKSHMSSHNDIRPFICEICGQGYKNKSALDIHVGMHNGINPFTCILCNKSFTQKGALRRHMPIHTGEAPYQCDLCGKRFVHHTSFHIHQLSHSGQKHYKCSICGLALFSGSHLKRHMRVHTGERNYACPVCGKRFAERYNLASHQKLHDNPGSSKSARKSYRCQICGNSFEKQMKLEEHLVKEHQKILETDSAASSQLTLSSTKQNSAWTDLKIEITGS